MDNNLEKVELVRDRTGATYTEAKEALEKADWSVVDAIIAIEEEQNKANDAVDGGSLKDSPIFAKMKELVEAGNVTKIVIRKGDKKIFNFPVTAGVVGALLVPWGAIIGIVAALGAQCDIELYDKNGELIDMNSKVNDAVEQVKGAAKLEELKNKFEESGAQEDIREAFVNGTAKLMGLWDKLEMEGKIEDVKDTVEKVAQRAVDTAKGIAKDAADKAEADKAAEDGADASEE